MNLLLTFFFPTGSGATLPTCTSGGKKAAITGRGDQSVERCSGHTLLQPAGVASGSGVL